MLEHLAWFISMFCSIPMPQPPPVETVVVPSVHFTYTDPQQVEDEFPRDEQIKVGIPLKDLSGLGDARARVFMALYVEDPDEPAEIAIQMSDKHCKYFQSKVIPFTPSLTEPYVRVGRLEDSDLRCGADHFVGKTVCYLVVTKDKLKRPLIRLDPDEVADYFAYAYRFVVDADGRSPCSTGTEREDRVAEQERRRHPARYAAARSVSKKAQRKIAELDGPKECVKVSK